MKTRIGLVGVLALGGCFGSMIQGQAMQTASVDHQCPAERVRVVSDATVGPDYAYWLDVCGQRRFYRYQQTATAGTGSGRFIDDTNRFQPNGGAR